MAKHIATRLMATFARVLLGFILACLTAGLVQVLYVVTPSDLAGSPGDLIAERLGGTAVLALETATHFAIFALAFTLIATGFAEWMSIRALPYYLAAGALIALLGFAAQFSSEAGGQPSVLNNYALQAFITSGFFGGLVYWLISGQFAGGPDDSDIASDPTTGVPAPAKAGDRPRILVQPSPPSAPKKSASLSDRLTKGDKPEVSQPADLAAAKPPTPGGPGKGPKTG
jgi:hypothetical protein